MSLIAQSGPQLVNRRDLDAVNKRVRASALHTAAEVEGRRIIDEHISAVDLLRQILGAQVVETTLPITRTRRTSG
jgi:hypothetical protein